MRRQKLLLPLVCYLLTALTWAPKRLLAVVSPAPASVTGTVFLSLTAGLCLRYVSCEWRQPQTGEGLDLTFPRLKQVLQPAAFQFLAFIYLWAARTSQQGWHFTKLGHCLAAANEPQEQLKAFLLLHRLLLSIRAEDHRCGQVQNRGAQPTQSVLDCCSLGEQNVLSVIRDQLHQIQTGLFITFWESSGFQQTVTGQCQYASSRCLIMYLADTSPRAAPFHWRTPPCTTRDRQRRRGPLSLTEGGWHCSVASASLDTAQKWRTDTWPRNKHSAVIRRKRHAGL